MTSNTKKNNDEKPCQAEVQLVKLRKTLHYVDKTQDQTQQVKNF